MTLLDLAALAESPRRPFLCRIGIHETARVDWLITTGHSVCVKCGSVSLESLFGDFELSRAESAKFLRDSGSRRMAETVQLARGEARQSGGEAASPSLSHPLPSDTPGDKPHDG